MTVREDSYALFVLDPELHRLVRFHGSYEKALDAAKKCGRVLQPLPSLQGIECAEVAA